MKYRGNKKHPIAFLLAALLACQPVSALAVTFADIDQVPWPGAEVSINKAADLGLVVGETRNGKSYFKPKDPVSLSESCQFAYKVMVQTGKATANASVTEKWTIVMNTYKIQSWAHTAVAYCLENNIISISDLSGFVSGETNRSATKEQAAEILGRALEVGVPSLRATATTTNFVDNASISADARPYIALLNSQKIVNGDDLNKFSPQKTLNRTETAVMVTNLYSVLKNTASTPAVTPITSKTGTVADLTNFYVNLENSSSYYLFSSSGITVTLNKESSSVTELVNLFKNDGEIQVELSFDSNNRVNKIVATSGDAEEEKATEGVLTKVKYDSEENDGRIVLDEKHTYIIDDADRVSIDIDDEDYDLDDLAELFDELKTDEEITVKLTLNKDGDVTKIVGTLYGGKYEAIGKLTALKYDDDDYGEISVDKEDYEIEDITEIVVKLDDDTIDFEDLEEAFDDLDSDEYIKVHLTLDKDEYVTKIVATTVDTGSKSSTKGIITDIDEDGDEGYLELDNENDFDIEDIDYVDIEIVDGDDEIDDWDELLDAIADGKTIDVELDLDSDDYVIEIKGDVTKTKGYLKGMTYDSDEDEYTLSIKDNSSADYIFKGNDTSNTVKITSMSAKTIAQLYDWMVDYYSSSDKIKVTVSLDSNGYVKSIDGKLD